jgi:hypothetical protein
MCLEHPRARETSKSARLEWNVMVNIRGDTIAVIAT